MNRFKELKVWQKAMDMATFVYKLTESFPHTEKFGLISQINRASVSIPSNIAEGAGRNSRNEFRNFLGIAIGSSFELETQLILAERLSYIREEELSDAQGMITEIQNMLIGLQRSLN
jgi:four helix bundle protein